ncbi:MAG: discoidin domain-containing protein [Candidatus Neomarinimicrobiota bacterium]
MRQNMIQLSLIFLLLSGIVLGTDYTADLCTGGTVTAQSENDGCEAFKAFDNNTSASSWESWDSAPQWLQYDFGSDNTKTIVRYRIFSSPAEQNDENPKDWDFKGSINGSSWTTLHSVTGASMAPDTWYTYDFSNSTAYQFYQINITVGNGADWVTIPEMEMMAATSATITFADGSGFSPTVTAGNDNQAVGRF